MSGVEPRPGSVTIINMCRSASVFNWHRTCFDGSFPHPCTAALANASCTASAISSSFCSGTSSRPNVSEMALTTAPIASASAGIRRSSNSESVGFFRTTAEFSRHGRSFRLDVTEMDFLSGERFYRRFVTVENLEQIENTYQAQSLYRKFRGLYQLDRSAALLDRSEKLY